MPLENPLFDKTPDLPETLPIPPAALFGSLSADIPLLMLPVRLETRFYRDPNRLRIRIYPDQIHLNSHQAALSDTEAQVGHRFWQIVWKLGWNRAERVFERLAERLGVWRATWVVEATAPSNLDKLGSDEPIFPPFNATKVDGAPAQIALLPNRWFAVGYLHGEVAFVEYGELIPETLRFAPFQMQETDDLDHWTINFDAAKRVGMALEVALTGSRETVINEGLDELIVVGARFGDPDALAQTLENTLQGHYYTRGFDFVPQGTPTNNTETVRSSWQWDSADTATVFERLWQPTPAIPDSHRARFSQALGLNDAGITGRAVHGDASEVPAMEAMNHALWYITWGEYLRFVLNDGEKSVLSDAAIDWLRDWFVGHVRGGAMYPAFQIGAMPYGILPIQLQPNPRDAHTEEEYVQWTLWRLRDGWERSLPNVPHLDPTATASATNAPTTTDLEQESESLFALLSSHPHPIQLFTRELNNLRTWPFWSIFFDPVDLYEALKARLIALSATVDSAWSDDIEHDMPDPFDSLDTQLDYYQDLLASLDRRVDGLQTQLDAFPRPVPLDLRDDQDALVDKRNTVDIDIRGVIEQILVFLQSHANRVLPLNSLGLPPVMDVLSAETPNPEHFYFVYSETDTAWGDLPLVQGANAEDGATAAVYLDWLHKYALGSVSGIGPEGMPDPAPLLFQLIKRSVDRANAWDESSLYTLDEFLGGLSRVTRMTSMGDRVDAVKRLNVNLSTTTNLLSQALNSPTNDPTRQAVASVPRTAFSSASAQLREYQQVTQTQTTSVNQAIRLLDQWAAQPGSVSTIPTWGGTEYVPVKPGGRVRLLANAIAALVSLPVEELELRMKETLGLAMHRLDAWISAYAEARVATMRAKQPSGIQVGGYGWVENLRPDEAGALASQGYIHAPSMTQAATAAVLRSGYAAYSDGTSTSPLSVDLRSDRVRVARWMMDGLRQGQRLNDLLGYRFERYLHDHFLDIWIDPVRDAVADSTHPSVMVDGLALLELWDEGKGTLESLVTVPANHLFSEIESALEQLVWITDAMADLTLAENVHALVQGDYERASAVQKASALGDVAPPELRSILTPNSGMTVTHRLLLLPQDTGSTWEQGKMSVRKLLEPALESWVASVVGAPDRVIYQVSADGVIDTLSMKTLPLSALDAVYLAPVGEQIAGSGLAAVIEGVYRLSNSNVERVSIEADVPVNDEQMSLADFILLANSVRSVLSSARSATPGDFVLGESHDPDSSELEQRAIDVVRWFATAVANLGTAVNGTMIEALVQLSYFNLPQAFPVSNDTDALLAQVAAVQPIAQARLDDVQAKLEAAQAGEFSVTQRIKMAREIIAAILGGNFPVILRFQTPLQADQVQDEANVGSDDPRAVMGWLLKLARVHPDLAALRNTIVAAEALQDRALFPFWIAQLPHIEGEAWAGFTRPNVGGTDRLSLVLTTNGDTPALTGESGGLVLDQWIERIPSDYEMTGLTFHFDAPTSRPPQALLLAVPPVNASWSFDLVLDTVREGFALARLRAVAPETLNEYGHQLPAVYLTSNLDTIGATNGG